MTPNDKQQFGMVMLGLAENYSASMTAAGINMRFEALKQFEISEIKAAALSLMARRKYTNMPTVADFLEHLGGGAAEDIAEVEAGKVMRAVTEHGAYRSVVFDNPVTQAVINEVYGGWPKLCELLVDKWFRHEFVKVFAAYSRQGQKRFGHLPGLVEIDNTAKGQDKFIPLPVSIGDPAKALSVLMEGKQQNDLAALGWKFFSAGELNSVADIGK